MVFSIKNSKIQGKTIPSPVIISCSPSYSIFLGKGIVERIQYEQKDCIHCQKRIAVKQMD